MQKPIIMENVQMINAEKKLLLANDKYWEILVCYIFNVLMIGHLQGCH